MAEGSGVRQDTATGDTLLCHEIRETINRLNGQIKEAACRGIKVDITTYDLGTFGAPMTTVVQARTYKEI